MPTETHTYTIELKCSMDAAKYQVMVDAMMHIAREFLAVATLLQDGKAPQVICRTEDNFFDVREIIVTAPDTSEGS